MGTQRDRTRRTAGRRRHRQSGDEERLATLQSTVTEQRDRIDRLERTLDALRRRLGVSILGACPNCADGTLVARGTVTACDRCEWRQRLD